MSILAGAAAIGSSMVSQNSVLKTPANTGMLGVAQEYSATAKKTIIFRGVLEVEQVNNGYILKIGRVEGAMYDTYIATTIEEVNDRIKASMAAFRLESQ